MQRRYRLHYAPDNASLIVRLVLEEIGAPYETVLVDRARHEQRGAAYRALNPAGLIPVLETPQGPIFETGAILLWLADTHGTLAPAPHSPERGAFLKWLFFTANTLHADLRMLFYPEQYAGPDHGGALHATLTPRLRRHLSLLDKIAADQPPWLAPDTPSVLSYYIACLTRWMALYPRDVDRGWFNLAKTPHLGHLLTALEHRQATHTAQTAEGLGASPFTAPCLATPPEGSAI